MHKGYTTNYFIKFFTAIPNKSWTTGMFEHQGAKGNTTRCALGHCGVSYDHKYGAWTPKAKALIKILGHKGRVYGINDGDLGYDYLGKTPRARILRALRRVRAGKDI